MFGFIADILTTFFSILLPVFASYKALRTSDPAVLTPWLMYWTTLSLFLLLETHLYFILSWVPFYSWIRLGVHLYLVLPGKQGSVDIYKEYVHPFLEDHERQIDQIISEGHARAKAAGMDAVKRGIEYVRVNFLGGEPRRPTPPPSRNVSYSTYLFDRFTMPAARQGLAAAGTSDLFSLLGKAVQQATYPDSSTEQQKARDLADSGIIPVDLHGEERQRYVDTQREHLRTLLKAFDSEAFNADAATSGAQARSSLPRQPSSRKSYLAPQDGPYMHKSKSESEFEDLGYETMPDPEHYRVYPNDDERPSGPRRSTGREGSWSNWIWGSYGEKDSAIDVPKKEL
ncbi:TB2/DP1, HVA22 family [Teratosphaeria destructans]|uniref:Protein YOP1 n=1 Tax=Teratosphaeria destructans TaxID=418781 RepID=A0A9W7SIP0_9PEZI|nr:TB2/DP1, HVA22 family [Teratosphaeria destructans]